MSKVYLPLNASKSRVKAASEARKNRAEIVAAYSQGKVTRRELLSALKRSSGGIEALLELGMARGGQVPPSKAYVWRNLPLDVVEVRETVFDPRLPKGNCHFICYAHSLVLSQSK